MEPLKRGDKVQTVHVYEPRRWRTHEGGLGEVILVSGLYVQVFYPTLRRTKRYFVSSAAALSAPEIVLRPAHNAETEASSFWPSIRVKRVS